MGQNTVSATIMASLQELLQQDAQPLLDELITGVNAVASSWAAKLPAAVSPEAALGVSLLTGIAQIAAHAELGTVLRHNVPNPALLAPAAAPAPAVPVTPAAAPAEGDTSPGVVPFPGAGANEPA